MTREYPAMSYREAHAWEAMAKKRGVSKVARSQRGFMRAYEKAGTFAKVPKKWKEKRRNFIARHMAQAKDEDLWEKGKPSRRALALIMWAYMPPGRRRRNPQKFSSARTSLKQIPMLHKKAAKHLGPTNLDLGGGAYDLATAYLDDQGVRSAVYDPFNRPPEHNRRVEAWVRRLRGVDTVTVSNVLNVIPEPLERQKVIFSAARALRPGGKAFFAVYEGKGDGVGRQTGPDQWQENRRTKAYIPEIQAGFGAVKPLKGSGGKILVAEQPLV